jgi:hypothetical protein
MLLPAVPESRRAELTLLEPVQAIEKAWAEKRSTQIRKQRPLTYREDVSCDL